MAAYIVTHQGREHALSLHEGRPGLYEVILDGRTITADCCAAGEGPLSLIIDGRCYEADVDRTAGGDSLGVTISGHLFELDVVDDQRKRLARQRPTGLSGRQEVRAPMSGNLSQVLVSEGDPVAAGQVLMVLDAMKMANELAAPVAGVVGSLIARPGATVAASDLLCVVLPLNFEQRGAASAHRPPKDELPGRPGPG